MGTTQWLTLTEAAREFHVARGTLWAAVSAGRLPAVIASEVGVGRVGRSLLVRRGDAARTVLAMQPRARRAEYDHVRRTVMALTGQQPTLALADATLDALETYIRVRSEGGVSERAAVAHVADGLGRMMDGGANVPPEVPDIVHEAHRWAEGGL